MFFGESNFKLFDGLFGVLLQIFLYIYLLKLQILGKDVKQIYILFVLILQVFIS